MDVVTCIVITIMLVAILAISVAISLKIYGETRWLLGVAMILVGGFTLLMAFSLVGAIIGEMPLTGGRIPAAVVLISGALAVLRTAFKRFRQLGRQGHETLGPDPFSSNIDIHTKEDFTGEPTSRSKNGGSDSD